MTVLEIQSCLARLYVSAAFRQVFRTDPSRALASYQLTDAESAALTAIDAERLDLFAATLVTKRRKRFERGYPASFAMREPAVAAAVRRFVELHPAQPSTRSVADVLAFGRFAEAFVSDCAPGRPWASDVIRFERLSYTARADAGQPATAQPVRDGRPAVRPGIVVGEFGYDVIALDEQLRGEAVIDEVPQQPTTVIFRPGTDGGGQRMIRVNDAVAAVLRHCDGTATLPEVVQAVGRDLGAPDMADAISSAIATLADGGVLWPVGKDDRQ